MKIMIVLLTSVCFLAGCSSWSVSDCEGEYCSQTPATDTQDGEATWYCYSTPDAKEWTCQDESDPSKTLSLKQVGLEKVPDAATLAKLYRKSRAPGPHHQRGKYAPPRSKAPKPSSELQFADQSQAPFSERSQSLASAPEPQPLVAEQQESVRLPRESESTGQPQESVSQQRLTARHPQPVHQPKPIQLIATPPQQVARAGRPYSSAPIPEAGDGASSILQQPSGFYTIQLIALQDEPRILEYARDSGLKYPLYAHIQSKDRTLYVLLLGVYPDRLSAARAKDEWTENQGRSVKPWIRQLGPLQEAIRLAVR
jgi:hypothetical protein